LAKHLQIPPEQQNQFISSARRERSIDQTSLSYTPEVFFTKIQVSEKLPAFLKKYRVARSQKQTPFVAREREIEFLNRHFLSAQLLEGHFISGGRGGKTTCSRIQHACTGEHPI
jgi:hypothetical protein